MKRPITAVAMTQKLTNASGGCTKNRLSPVIFRTDAITNATARPSSVSTSKGGMYAHPREISAGVCDMGSRVHTAASVYIHATRSTATKVKGEPETSNVGFCIVPIVRFDAICH